ncbi:hypothetical protein GCM10020295_14600 [Streptomyces cinereospinus]
MCTVIARYDSGSGRAAKSAGVESGDWIASRMSFTVTVLPPAVSAPCGRALRVTSVLLRDGGSPSVRRVVRGFGSALWRGRVPVTQASGRAGRGPRGTAGVL